MPRPFRAAGRRDRARGIADIEAGRATVNASAVQSAASRLRGVGLNAPGGPAYARYNAILERIASFARAAEPAQRG